MLLKKGDNNEQVKQLQVKLHLDPVGNFGPKTEEAVKIWQTAHGLTADGIVGDKTWAMIMGEESHPVVQQAVAVANSTGLKLEKLKGHIPDAVIAMIPAVAQKFQIDSALRLAHFLAQCGHESGGFRLTKENLNYSALRLTQVFPKKFASLEAAKKAVSSGTKGIAEAIYGMRKDLGNTEVGDGGKFFGRGIIQLTGKANYTAYSKAIDKPEILINPDLLAEPEDAILSAGWFWKTNGLNFLADKGDLTVVTKRINGGTHGLAERITNTNKAFSVLT